MQLTGGDDKKVISTIAVTGKEQVMLRVRVAEVQRNVLKQFGINTEAVFDDRQVHFQLLQHQSVHAWLRAAP